MKNLINKKYQKLDKPSFNSLLASFLKERNIELSSGKKVFYKIGGKLLEILFFGFASYLFFCVLIAIYYWYFEYFKTAIIVISLQNVILMYLEYTIYFMLFFSCFLILKEIYLLIEFVRFIKKNKSHD